MSHLGKLEAEKAQLLAEIAELNARQTLPPPPPPPPPPRLPPSPGWGSPQPPGWGSPHDEALLDAEPSPGPSQPESPKPPSPKTAAPKHASYAAAAASAVDVPKFFFKGVPTRASTDVDRFSASQGADVRWRRVKQEKKEKGKRKQP